MKSNKIHLPILNVIEGSCDPKVHNDYLESISVIPLIELLPKLVMEEELELESNALTAQRMEEECLRNMSFKHKVQYKKLEMKLDVKELSSKN